MAISGNYARANKIKLEDSIKLNDKNFKVVGIVSLPDYSSILRNRDDLVMDTGYYGTCLLDKDGFELFKDVPIKYTYSYHTKNNLTKKPANDKLKDLIKIIMKKNVVIDAVTRYDNHCITYLMDDMDGDVPTMTTFMVILFIALAFVSAVQIKSMIEKESSVIGTLLASGYTKAELLKNYMITPVIMTLFSAVVGNVISYSYAYKKYVFLYYQSFDLPKFKPIISLRSFLITCIIPLTIYMVINLLVISMKLKATPLEFLRGTFKREKRKSKVKLTKFNIMTKFKLRMFLDNKFNLIALVFGIFLANMILLYGLSVKPIFESYSENMKNTMKYNYTYFVRTEEKNVKADKSTILDVELTDNDNKKVQFYGVDDNSNYKIKNLSQLKKDEVVNEEGDDVVLVDKTHNRKNDRIWSSGTGDQVYLSIRLAMALAFGKQVETLPIVLDDIFVRFDEDRQRQTLRFLMELGKEQQIFLFTCHKRTMEIAQEVGKELQTGAFIRLQSGQVVTDFNTSSNNL